MSKLELPFKPFTFEEVQRITKADTTFIDWITKDCLPPKVGCGVVGLDWMQTFGVFVGWRYAQEGATTGRVLATAAFVGYSVLSTLEQEIKAGRTLPIPRSVLIANGVNAKSGMMVPAPDDYLGKTLNLKVLLDQFRARIAESFPNG